MSAIAKFRVTGPDSTLVVQIPAAVLIRSFRITDQGPPGAPGAGKNWVIAETPAGAINGSNTDFATAAAFDDLCVYLNGLRLLPADFTAVSAQVFGLTEAPLPGDSLTVDYSL